MRLPASTPKTQVFGPRAALALPSWELGVEEDYTIDEEVEAADIVGRISSVLRTLSPREERVLRLRFGIGCEEHTLDGAGEQLGVTRERIRQIEAKAMRKLKHPSRARGLRSFFAERPKARPKAEHRFRHRAYIDLDVPVRAKEFVPIEHWRGVLDSFRPEVFAEVDGEMVRIRPTGVSTKPEVCAEFGGTDAVILFTHNGQQYGEDWRAVRKIKWTTVRGAGFRTERVRVH